MEMNGIPFARCSQTADVNKNKARLAANPQFGNRAQVSLKANDVFQRSNHGAASVRFGVKDAAEQQGVDDVVHSTHRWLSTQEHAKEMGDKEYSHADKVAKWKAKKKSYNSKNGLTPATSGLDPATDSDGEG